ncbi:hypothetical protein BaRGS_00020792 [Batillaria attramentaria]|uniref:Uncharacterized protein n=1 Tax=Batillaria attramentaria TaxID=370345 RepID=A0ABD0KLD8_9CAEN
MLFQGILFSGCLIPFPGDSVQWMPDSVSCGEYWKLYETTQHDTETEAEGSPRVWRKGDEVVKLCRMKLQVRTTVPPSTPVSQQSSVMLQICCSQDSEIEAEWRYKAQLLSTRIARRTVS